MVGRVVASLALVASLLACAPRRALTIEPILPAGTSLTYRFRSEVTTTLVRGERREISSTLEGEVRVEVLRVDPDGRALRVELRPHASTRDGRVTEPGPSQRRRIFLEDDGTVRAPAEAAGGFGDTELGPDLLASVLDPLVPSPIANPGDRWQDAGGQGRLAGLDREAGHDVARLELFGDRAVSRQRPLEGRPVDLVGRERTATVLRWDLDAGIARGAELTSDADYEVRAGALLGGRIEVVATTLVELVEHVAGTASPQPS